MFSLPRTATAPFCPSEVRGSISIPRGASFWFRLVRLSGPGLLVSVGYVDPGNWATDIAAGSQYGFALLWVVLASSLFAMLLQTLSVRLGLATGLDLARACRKRYPPSVNRVLWLMAELAIVATDIAEVLGSALALQLLFGLSILVGIVITAFDMLIVVGLQGRGFRQVEAIVLGLMATIGLCLAVQLILVGPNWPEVWRGFVPRASLMTDPQATLLAIGILGATVMPHNLYLHSSIVQTRHVADDEPSRRDAIWLATIDTIVALSLAFVVNAAILVLAGAAFHATGHHDVVELQDAYHLLDPIVGATGASLLFGIGLLASGQSSTFTGTIAGQILMEGFLDLKIPCWQRRVITRGLAVVPAFAGIAWFGESALGVMLVLSQVVLGLQLPFAIGPLIRMTGDRRLMGPFASRFGLASAAYLLFVVITGANIWLLWSIVSP
jgi:manganese transport protein